MTTTVPTATSLTASAAPSPRLPIRVPLPACPAVAAWVATREITRPPDGPVDADGRAVTPSDLRGLHRVGFGRPAGPAAAGHPPQPQPRTSPPSPPLIASG